MRDGDLWIWEGGRERQLTQEGTVERPRFSADGEYVLYDRNGGARYVSLASGGSWPLPDGGSSWSPTGPVLGLVGGILTTRVTPHGPLKAERAVFGGGFGAWAPDGRRIAVLRGEPGNTAWLGIADVTTGEVRKLLEEASPVSEPATCPVGGPSAPLAWSADGKWISFWRPGLTASTHMDCNELAVIPAEGGSPLTLGASPMNPAWVSWAPVGGTLAFTDGPGRTATRGKVVRLAALSAGVPVKTLTPEGYADRDPAWSPDARYVSLTRSRGEEPSRVWVVEAATGKAKPVPGSENGMAARWGRGGSLIWVRPGGTVHGAPRWDQAPTQLVQGVDRPREYYGQWYWDTVLDYWPGPPAK